MRIRSAVDIEDAAPGAEASDRECRIKAGYRRLLRAGLDGKGSESKVQRLKPKVQRPSSAECGVRSAENQVPGPESTVHGPKAPTQDLRPETQDSTRRGPGAVEYLSGFLCACCALALL